MILIASSLINAIGCRISPSRLARLGRRCVPLMLFFAFVSHAHAELVLVVSAHSGINSLAPEQISDIFFGKAAHLANGQPVTPVDQNQDAPDRTDFYLAISGKTPTLMKAYWSKMFFTSEGRPPIEISNTDTLRKYVEHNTSALTYMEKSEVTGELKIIAVIH